MSKVNINIRLKKRFMSIYCFQASRADINISALQNSIRRHTRINMKIDPCIAETLNPYILNPKSAAEPWAHRFGPMPRPSRADTWVRTRAWVATYSIGNFFMPCHSEGFELKMLGDSVLRTDKCWHLVRGIARQARLSKRRHTAHHTLTGIAPLSLGAEKSCFLSNVL